MALGRWQNYVHCMRLSYIGYGGHDFRTDANALDGVVHGLLAIRDRERGHLGLERETHPEDWFLSDRLGHAAQAAVGADAART